MLHLILTGIGRSPAMRVGWVVAGFLGAVLLLGFSEPRSGGIELTLDPVEALATRNGPRIVVHLDGKSVGELSFAEPNLSVAVAGEAAIAFSYEGVNGESTDVTWTETVRSTDKNLVVVQPWRQRREKNTWQVLAWSRQEDGRGVLENISDTVTAVAPIWWTIDNQGDLRSAVDPDTVAFLRERGIAAWPAVQGMNADGLHTFLANPARRSLVAALIAGEARKHGAQGVNIDVEGFRVEDSEGAIAFVEELARLVRAWQGTVSYDLVSRSDTWQTLPMELSYWSTAPQRRRLAAAVDYTILMAYDQFNDHRPAGPVAAPDWVEEMLTYLLRYADPQKIILGIPAYGRIWNPKALDAPRALPLAQLDGRDGIKSFDQRYCMSRIDRPDGRFYWVEKEIEEARLKMAYDFNLAGVAVWRLGLDDPELWRAIRILDKGRHASSHQHITIPKSACREAGR